MKIQLCLILAAILFAVQLPAQTTKTSKRIQEAQEAVENTAEIITTADKTIKTLFPRKKKKTPAGADTPEKTNNNGENVSKKEGSSAIDKPQAGSTKNSSGLQPGDVHPDAKVIDADDLDPFNKGAALIRKGSSYALINKDGDFIVPYNKYSFNDGSQRDFNTGAWSQSGIFIVRLPDNDGAINYQGKLITGEYPSLSWSITKNRLLIYADDNNGNWIFMNAEGQKYILKQSKDYIIEPDTFSEGAVRVQSRKSGNGFIGFKNLKDEWIAKPQYDWAEPFSEGLACVTKEDQFGELKHGFINQEGKVVIDLIYSERPSNFLGGLSRVSPKDKTEFKEAYIDKKGNIMVKFNQINEYKYMGDGLYLEKSKRKSLLNAEGHIIPANEFLKTYGVTMDASKEKDLFIWDLSEVAKQNYIGKVRFRRSLKQSGAVLNSGFINIETKKVIEGRFTGTNLFVFDPVSRLATAQFFIDKETGYKSKLREGYINEDGIFVIVKGEKSKW